MVTPPVKVSIALASCNGAQFLGEQLASLAAQDRLPDELVVSDDASTDTTRQVVERFAASAPFPVRFHAFESRLGCNANFERAAHLCSGGIILFSDQDDVWLPAHVRKLAEPFETDAHVGLVTSNSLYVDADLHPTGPTVWSAERLTRLHLRRQQRRWQFPAWVRARAIAGHGMGFRANLREMLFPVTQNWLYDQWIAVLATAFSRGVVVPEILTFHRLHANQTDGNRAPTLAQWYAAAPTLGRDHFTRQIDLWQEILERTTSFRDRLVDARVPGVLERRIAFLRERQSLRNGGNVRRIGAALGLLMRGHYHRHSRGFLTFGRDVVG